MTNLIEQWEGKATIQGIPAVVEFKVEEDVLAGESSGLKRWAGKLTAQAPITFADGDIYLDDGRHGEIVITELEPIEVTRMGDIWPHYLLSGRGTFIGSGPSPT